MKRASALRSALALLVLAVLVLAAAGCAKKLTVDPSFAVLEGMPSPKARLIVYQDMKDAARARTLANFIEWAMHDGQEMAAALDYARLPEGVIRVNEATLHTLTAGGKKLLP